MSVAERRMGRSSLAIVASAVLALVAVTSSAAPGSSRRAKKRRAPHAVAAEAPVRAIEEPHGEDMAPAMTSSTAHTSSVAGAGTSTSGAARGPAVPAINYYALLLHDDLVAELERRHLAGGPLPVLLERLTRGLVGAPYVLSPLGEGVEPDADPRFRLDAFDCTTFVETALALSRCDGLDDVAKELDQIRYADGTPSYAKRRHLVTAEWIPDLARLGYVEDVTRAIGGDDTATIELQLDEKRWAKRRVAKTVALDASEVPTGTFPIAYIPIAAALKRAKQIPPGTIIDVVRSDWIGAPEVVTHQGLVLERPGDGARFVRHASPVSKRVIDEPLEHMLHRYAEPKQPKAWPVVGIHLLRVLAPEPTHTADR